MLYLARMDVTFPESMSPETKADFVAQEKEYSGNLKKSGKMRKGRRAVFNRRPSSGTTTLDVVTE